MDRQKALERVKGWSRRRKIITALVAALLVTVVGFAALSNPQGIWEPVGLTAQNTDLDQPPYMRFDRDGSVSGSLGCNEFDHVYVHHWWGPFEVENGRLGDTLMACGGADMADPTGIFFVFGNRMVMFDHGLHAVVWRRVN